MKGGSVSRVRYLFHDSVSSVPHVERNSRSPSAQLMRVIPSGNMPNDASLMIGLGDEPDFCGRVNRERNGKAIHREPDDEVEGVRQSIFWRLGRGK